MLLLLFVFVWRRAFEPGETLEPYESDKSFKPFEPLQEGTVMRLLLTSVRPVQIDSKDIKGSNDSYGSNDLHGAKDSNIYMI